MPKKDKTKIYRPKSGVVPTYETYPVTDNYTDENGRVYNRSVENVIQAKEETDANKK